MPRRFQNLFTTTLAGGGITAVATSMTLTANPTGLSLAAGEYVVFTLINGATREYIKATTVSGTAVSGMTRAVEGSTASAFPAGATVQIAVTAASMENVFDSTEADFLLVQSTDMTPVAGKLGVQARYVANRAMLQMMGPSGLDTVLQPYLARNKMTIWNPAGNSTTITSFGSAALTATGTATAANVATTNRHTYQKRVEFLVTVAATTAVAGWRNAVAQWTIGGGAAGDGGFTFVCRWGPATGVGTTTNRAFVGMGASTAAPTDVEPSTIANMIGMGWDAADTNIQLMRRDGATLTKIDLGASFPVPTTDRAKSYELALFSPPGTTQSVGYQVTDLGTGAVTFGTITTLLPATSTLLTPRGWMSVGGTSSVIGIALMSLYVESDY